MPDTQIDHRRLLQTDLVWICVVPESGIARRVDDATRYA
jgi:hypothetical protein